jgi:transcriptional regulator with XRE-family HTH domain
MVKKRACTPRVCRFPSRHVLGILSKNIKKFRSARGYSQELLAEKCGLHRTYVGAVERGERNPSLGSIEVIALALGVTPSMLIME